MESENTKISSNWTERAVPVPLKRLTLIPEVHRARSPAQMTCERSFFFLIFFMQLYLTGSAFQVEYGKVHS